MKTFVFFLLVTFFTCHSVNAQLNSYTFTSTSGTFTSITAGTVLGTVANDEQVFNNNTTGAVAPQTDIGFPIGFNFNYNGSIFDRFAVNTNGWITLGTGTFTIGGTTTPISNSTTEGFTNVLSVMGRDLQGQTGSELSYMLTGSAPSRILVVQWLNYRRFGIVSGESFNFQIRLNEASNSIDFVYGTVTTTNVSTTTANNPTQVGIRGTGNSDFNNRTTTTSWPASVAGTLNTKTMKLTTTVGPASGLTYTWTPVAMSYVSSTTLQADTSLVMKNSSNNQVLKIQVVVNGTLNPLSVTNFTLTDIGTTNVSDIANAKVWYTGTSSTFDTTTQFGSTVNPGGLYLVPGSQQLTSGTNYFWVTNDIPLSAVTADKVDGGCYAILIVSYRTPTITTPAGSRTIANTPLIGDYNIGLGLFNLVIGRNLYFKKQTGMVLMDKFIRGDNFNNKKKAADHTGIAGDCERVSSEEEQDTFVLMDGDAPYTGSQLIKVTADMRNKFGRGLIPDNVNGIYSNITAAVNDVNVRGIQGPVVFYLTDALYNSETFPVIINNIYGTSLASTLTLKPASNVSPQVVMSSGVTMLKIYRSSYVTIDGSNIVNGTSKDLTFTSNYASTSYCIWIGSSGSRTESNITVKNCNIKAGENINGSAPILVSDGDFLGNPGYFSNITIQNNVLQRGRQAVFVNGGTVPQNIYNVNIYDNVINSTATDAIGFMGIYLQGVNNADIRGNEIANLDDAGNQNDIGIWVASGSQGVTVERNKIYNLGYTGVNGYGAYGIYLSSGHLNAAIEVRNNLIYNIYGTGSSYTDALYFSDNPAGIFLYSSTSQSGMNIFNNSINLYGNTLNQTLALSSGIFVTTGSTVDIRNNAITNNLGLNSATGYGSCAVFVQNSQTQFLNIDYNIYYVNPSGSGVSAIGKISTITTAADIVSWKTATGKDKSSLYNDPGFTSNTNLVPDANNQNSWSLNGRGTQISIVTNDYNGNARSITLTGGAPDIGAYEFTPAPQPPVASQTGGITDGGTTNYVFAGDTVAVIVWHGVSLPTSVSVKYFSGTNPPGASTGKYGNCYWTFAPTGGSGYTFDMTLYYDPVLIGTIAGVNNIMIANYTLGVWTHYNATANSTLRNVTQNGLSNLTTFTIDDGTVPLPVTMIYFNALTSSRDVMLKWATASEINNSGFEVQRKSESESGWSKIGFVNGGGTVVGERDYSFNDIKLNIGKYSYRIKQIDFNGNFEYHNLAADVIIGKPIAFGMSQNYPNPSNPKTKIDYQIPNDGLVSIKVYDIQGREVATIVNGFLNAGYYTGEFDGTNIASGVYFYRINSAKFTQTMRLVLLK